MIDATEVTAGRDPLVVGPPVVGGNGVGVSSVVDRDPPVDGLPGRPHAATFAVSDVTPPAVKDDRITSRRLTPHGWWHAAQADGR